MLAKSKSRSRTTAWQASLTKVMQGYYYVYVLVSEQDEAVHYTGITDNLAERLAKHNSGGSPNSAKHRPWRIETAVAFRSREKAAAFERYLKSGSGREFARRHF